MEVTMKSYVLCCILVVLVQKCHSSFDADMQALEKDLKDEEMRRSQKKSVADMTTDELIEELKKDITTTNKEKKSVKERFHDITKTALSDDFEKLLLTDEKKHVESSQKKSIDSTTTQQYHDAVQAKTIKKDEGMDTALLKRALTTIHDLSDAELNDAAIQNKGMELLKELMKADKKTLDKRTKETVKFTTALNGDTANMKQLADKKAALDEKAKNVKKEKKGEVIEDVLKLMADDLIKKINDEVSRDAKLNKREKDADQCTDKRSDCGTLKKYCDTHEKKLKVICAKTCEYCSKPCADVWIGKDAHRCEVVKMASRCHEENVDKYCAKTCGYCGAPAPPRCSKTQYGCCWDKETMKADKAGSNCQACDDEYVYVCKRFKVECPNTNIAGAFMRKNCPKTCNVCSDVCKNDPGKAFYCPFWKKDLNWCRARPEVMRHFCPVTCGLC